ncbi:MAG: metal ABC transporter permease, partial [Planctomycetes bacterium]|nr:metal ABC transporter permease [Planctomycetota bacterium]
MSDWQDFDSWIVLTGLLAAMACSLCGTWLFLRRQSLMGDALSHAVLPGIVVAFLLTHVLDDSFIRSRSLSDSTGINEPASSQIKGTDLVRVIRHQVFLFAGAAISGLIAAIGSEFIHRWGRLDRGAAMGVVFTSMFALGLLLIRAFADRAHIDTDCVLYGNLETVASDIVTGTDLPKGVIVCSMVLLLNVIFILVGYRSLLITTFDKELAKSFGCRVDGISVMLMSLTAATVVAAFESVGAILVIAMLIVPVATARLLSDRLPRILLFAPLIAGLSAILGHVFALTLPGMVSSRIGLKGVDDASTTGMMAVTSGVFFLTAVIFSPKRGLFRAWSDRVYLQIRIAAEDHLGRLYRSVERQSHVVGQGQLQNTQKDSSNDVDSP